MNQKPSKYIISAAEAESMARSKGLTVPQLLPSLVKSAQDLARPPISRFPVGAVGLGSDGRIFLGGNVEFPGLPLHHSIHAEQFLVTNLAAHGGGPTLLNIAVSAAPCGHCRQFLQELRRVSETQIVITDQPISSKPNPDYKPISSILPNPFGPFDLLDQETPLILEKHNNKLSLKSPDLDPDSSNILSNGKNSSSLLLSSSNGNCEKSEKEEEEEALKAEALEAARGSHAPYSNCPSGVALMDCEGRVYGGSYMESAAYNPSMMPVQAALVAFMVAGGGGYERIAAAVLVEKEGAAVRQEDTARFFFWNKWLPPRVNCFIWRLLLERLPTRTKLRSRGINISSAVCPLCKAEEESVDHVFLFCPQVQAIWNWFFHWRGIVKGQILSLDQLILEVSDQGSNKNRKKLLEAAVGGVLWQVWKARNNAVFNGKKFSAPLVMDDVQASLFTWVKYRAKCSSLSWSSWCCNPVLSF